MTSSGPILPPFDRKIIILSVAQAVAGSAIPVFFLISGLAGARLAPSLRLATLPMSLVVIGLALSSPMASGIMSRWGRKRGHLLGILLSMFGAGVAVVGLSGSRFWIYCVACAIAGSGAAFNNQIRFTAAEKSGERAATIHSWILTMSLVCAFLGPWIAEGGREMLPAGEYAGSALILLVLLSGLFVLMLGLPAGATIREVPVLGRTGNISYVLRQRVFWMAAFAGMASYATMTLLMSATPLQMGEIERFSVSETTQTIQSHIAAMYLPSLFSGFLISRIGIRKIMLIGITLFLVCIAIARHSSHFHHYWSALVLLGVGWNFLFLASSTTISVSFSGPERFAAQGANDAIVFGTQAMASLAAGWTLFAVGWKTLVLIPLPLLTVVAVAALRDLLLVRRLQ